MAPQPFLIESQKLRWCTIGKAAYIDRHACDSSIYFLDNLARMAANSYVPSDNDNILHPRLQTISVHEEHFYVRPRSIKFRIYDFG